MQHEHYFRALSTNTTEMRDIFRFAAPIPLIGRIVEILVLRRYMADLLHERHQAIKQIAESNDWSQYLPPCE